jgi:hypothetical protein
MRTGNGVEVIGTYFIEGNHAAITINRTALMTMEIAMYSTGPTFNGTTGLLEPLLLTRYPMAESSFTSTDCGLLDHRRYLHTRRLIVDELATSILV